MNLKLKRMVVGILIFTATIFCNACNLSNCVIVYDGNGNTGGSVPVDTVLYNFLDRVAVPDNTGNLTKPDHTFAGWSKDASGKGKTYTAGETFLMGMSDVTLYAVWDDATQCVFKNCFPEIFQCLLDTECFSWLSCLQDCGDDKFVCPTYCGLYYQSPKITQITFCALGNECPVVDFSDFGPCEVPDAELLDLSNMSGTWWLSAASDEDHLFEYDCQKFIFEDQDPTQDPILLNVYFTVTVSRDGVEKQRGTGCTFEEMIDGPIKVEYDSYNVYHEKWYFVHKSENTLLSHVCFLIDVDCKDYATLILSRMPLDDLDISEYNDLDAAVNKYFGTGIEQLVPIEIEGCEN